MHGTITPTLSFISSLCPPTSADTTGTPMANDSYEVSANPSFIDVFTVKSLILYTFAVSFMFPRYINFFSIPYFFILFFISDKNGPSPATTTIKSFLFLLSSFITSTNKYGLFWSAILHIKLIINLSFGTILYSSNIFSLLYNSGLNLFSSTPIYTVSTSFSFLPK